MGQSAILRRYVDDDESMPFKTRAFYIKVIMDHARVPDLMVELTNSSWPVRVVRLHQSDLYGDDVDPVNSNGGGARRRGVGIGPAAAAGGLGGGGARRSAFQPPARQPSGSPEGIGIAGGFENSAAGQAAQEVRNAQAAAMANPNLVEVVVAGLMTLYRPVEEEEAATEGAADGTEPAAEGQNPDAPQEPATTEPQPDSSSETASPEGTDVDPKSATPEKAPEENSKPGTPEPAEKSDETPAVEKPKSEKPDQNPDDTKPESAANGGEKPDDNR